MANWFGTARSNYFMVKDLAAFQAMVESEIPDVDVVVSDQSDGPRAGKVCLLASADSDNGDFPTTRFDDELEEDVEIHFPTMISPHLVEGEVVVLMTIGAEKQRYLTGYSVAFDHTGTEVRVDIGDIYDKARLAFGMNPDQATY